jgi:chloramphenicol 3-O phosphotransferase
MHRTVAALADTGLDVIVDHVLLDPDWLPECRRLWAPFETLFVGVRCPLEIVVERERRRSDRTIGQAEAQFAVLHQAGGYDIEVDTSVESPSEAASRIVAVLARRSRD